MNPLASVHLSVEPTRARSDGSAKFFFNDFLESESDAWKTFGLYARGAAGRDRDHRRLGRPVVAGRSVGPGSGPADELQQQRQADRLGPAQLPFGVQTVPGSPCRNDGHERLPE